MLAGPVEFTNFEQSSRYAQLGTAGGWGEVRALYDGSDGSNNFPNASGKPAGVHSTNADVRLQAILVGNVAVVKPSLALQRVGIQRAAPGARTHTAAGNASQRE